MKKYQKTWLPTISDCDAFKHVNNVKYLAQLEKAAWEHSHTLGIGMKQFEQENCALVVHRHEIDYLQPAHVGDELTITTWLAEPDSRCAFIRFYEIHIADTLILKAKTQWVSVSLDKGRVKRIPQSFIDLYWSKNELD